MFVTIAFQAAWVTAVHRMVRVSFLTSLNSLRMGARVADLPMLPDQKRRGFWNIEL